MEKIFYLIERKDTCEWFNTNLSGYYSVGFNGEPHGIAPDPTKNWVRDVNEATQFHKQEDAKSFLDNCEFIHDIPKSDCQVTEHMYVS